MKSNNSQTQKKKPTKSADVADFLTKTGFILEMEVSEWLKKHGYSVEVNQYFIDYDENKKREIDIIATKKINDIEVKLIIECKQSLVDDWIFICSDSRPSRYYAFQKHLPHMGNIKESKVFDHLHVFDTKIPLAQNYTIRSIDNKKSNSTQIESCIEKLPKIVVDIANSVDSKKVRTLFVPMAVFNGKMFTANYQTKLLVKEVDLVQYQVNLESDGYTYHYRGDSISRIYAFSTLDTGTEEKEERKKNSAVASISRDLHAYYLLDFVTKKGLSSLIKRIEAEVGKIDNELWSLKSEELLPRVPKT